MRTLDKNKTKLWYIEPSTEVDEKDSDGNYTGEKTFTYTTPIQISICIYPSTKEITETIFGKDLNLDMIAVTNDLKFSENGLLFYTQPSINFDTTYDYSISSIAKSLNATNYGLNRRV